MYACHLKFFFFFFWNFLQKLFRSEKRIYYARKLIILYSNATGYTDVNL